MAATSTHLDAQIADADDLAGMNFRGLAQFGGAIDLDLAAGDQLFAGAAAAALTGEFEQLIEFDIVAL